MNGITGLPGGAGAANGAAGADAASQAQAQFEQALGEGAVQVGSFIMQFITQDILDSLNKDPVDIEK